MVDGADATTAVGAECGCTAAYNPRYSSEQRDRRSPCRVHYTATTQIRETDFAATKMIPNLKCDCFSLAELQTICQMYWHRIYNLEGDKYELERAIEIKKMEVNYIN
ncbi:hypothetical protein HW555_008903 [Spodoptera exigua]|uniref:Uncharacterized protein n=1 Tax=Spodoptera exigua TaxID=7107 RepID=A0A835GE19_SPOEX|nr:hypothetical protein HW555_008903 [Spodoptera exigua]